MTTTVADSTPLIGLSRIGRVDLIPLVLGSVLVPPAVIEEVLVVGERFSGTAALRQATWIVRVPGVRLLPDTPGDLGRGEGEAIALAHARHLSVLTDDRSAGRFALAHGVPVLRTLDVLAVAEEGGYISDAEQIVAELVRSGFRLHPNVVAMFHDRMVAIRSRGVNQPRQAA